MCRLRRNVKDVNRLVFFQKFPVRLIFFFRLSETVTMRVGLIQGRCPAEC